jgi:hypothetical protein
MIIRMAPPYLRTYLLARSLILRSPVCLVTFLAVLLPFFSAILGFVGAIGFWPMTVGIELDRRARAP